MENTEVILINEFTRKQIKIVYLPRIPNINEVFKIENTYYKVRGIRFNIDTIEYGKGLTVTALLRDVD